MKTSDFNFNLPPELLAEHPSEHRDEARLMVLNRKNQTIEHKLFKDVIDYFDENDLFIFNNTKVFPARLFGNKEKTGAKIEVFLLRELDKDTRVWDVLVDPARKIRIGNKLFFDEDESLVAEVIDNTTSRGRTLRFLYDGSYEEFRAKLKELGETPLPKYIKREVEPEDAERYQTIYAKNEGAVAAPTAGLHFSKHLMKRLEIKGINFAEVTLHVGLGTFNPIEVEDLSKHKMECEEAFIDQKNADIINKAIDEDRRICAVGTTTMRTIETSVSSNRKLSAYHGWTNKFIYPPYDFAVADSMITNFHTPKSTLIMMIAAFAGKDFVMHAYEEAVKEKYKFYSYGDAMLIL
ncbi:tRNA preQ1(34) S-adenosylmethionine ribosyltransferase-isomerase QueA [Riemerella anatipestifer]|uniref:S-adenosylmethionine:tRNA ribosyltransferase-isomerase n=2 Tax=Riemerella anatipestifer TaxID=34085 RepID=J9R8Y6_RIEAN|nr:tRNA preQ1(34) S-adenosylmethionine ribosyltransferase-isomerase QueA [Riemerella anatipestifer]AFR36152.1 S-adenosylmethionine:tRNA-ribosyltransferase-isomerase (queuine synthetase) [Riemerella anatipestifer RA-CH-1]AQY21164.1 S-adenosylmethionine:tRNA ribosyltransferase-isomerase [Riemerella anatipestifer]MBO4234755.1 tRNA preQ1(34) S-adenosylmethionine ribosyltransferase-isomerase QueA [Riemerella anatipestifer]MCO4304589.1 tRNA preQ1(34) S-adenosylmethionine ribosyltransferase-isomerase 